MPQKQTEFNHSGLAPSDGSDKAYEKTFQQGTKRKRGRNLSLPQRYRESNGSTSDHDAANNKKVHGRQPASSKNGDEGLKFKHEQLALRRNLSKLPIWAQIHWVQVGLRGEKDVMFVAGETGSGKSTQVPQYLLREEWCHKKIAVTQPRRVAAISLARRVAEEMFTTLGKSSPASKVGYSVRFDNNVAPATRIKFLTEGMLLQEMLRDPWLTQYSAVIVDEVHERSVNVDLILGFLKMIVTGDRKGRNGEPLKVAIMSATYNTRALISFFHELLDEKQQSAQNKNAHQSLQTFKTASELSSESSWEGFSDSEEEDASRTPPDPQIDTRISTRMSTCYVKGRQYPVEVLYMPEPSQDFVEDACKAINKLHKTEPLPGDILVFLTGQDTIEAVESMLNDWIPLLGEGVPRVRVMPLFAALSRTAQQVVFQPTPPNTRKVILATNIAETSLTIPGVRYVVDSGLAKVREYRSQLGLETLLVRPISRSSAIQRKGRAGREAAGKCVRLYTEKDYLNLDVSNVPEILKCDVASAILNMKARGVEDVFTFPLLDAPRVGSMRQALLQLYRLGALEDNGSISKTGLSMARLPLSPSMSRVLIAASELNADTVLDTIDIIAALDVERLFVPIDTEEKMEEAEEARRNLVRREGDHMTMLATVQAYTAENADRTSWCNRHFVSHRAMRNVMDVRKQLQVQCVEQKLLGQRSVANANEASRHTAIAENSAPILQCFMKGFAANTARLMPDSSYRTVEGNHTVAIHPSSVLFGRKIEAIMYNELVFTVKSYARGVSAVQLDWYADAVGA